MLEAMKKKIYQQPNIRVVQVQHQQALLQSSPVTHINSGDTGIGYGGGSGDGARVKGQGDDSFWDSDWSE